MYTKYIEITVVDPLYRLVILIKYKTTELPKIISRSNDVTISIIKLKQFYGEQNSNSVLIGKFLRKSKKAK